MNLGDTRRAFLSSVLLAGGSVAAFGESLHYAPAAPTDQRDLLFDHVRHQLTDIVQSARSRGAALTAEDAASAAALMHVCGVHARGLQIDRTSSRALAARIATVGRPALIDASPDRHTVESMLRTRGLIVSERLITHVSQADLGARVAALAAIEHGRTTTACDSVASAFERGVAGMAGRWPGVRRINMADQAWCGFVLEQWAMYLSLAWYIASFVDPSLQGFLDALWAGLNLYDAIYAQQC